MKQIKIENNGVEQLITVPENSRVTIDGNVVVFEPKFKKGDIVSFDILSKFTAIYKNESEYFVIVSEDMYIQMLNAKSCSEKQLRLSTDSEKQLLFDALAKKGKQWNAEKLCIEDLKVVPKVGDCVRYDNTYTHYFVIGGFDKKGNPISKRDSYIDGVISYSGSSFERGNITILTKKQFQSELVQLGLEYNFENDTISELRWKPKRRRNLLAHYRRI